MKESITIEDIRKALYEEFKSSREMSHNGDSTKRILMNASMWGNRFLIRRLEGITGLHIMKRTKRMKESDKCQL